jgi:hypothetical protein
VRLIAGVEDDGSSIAYIDAVEGALPLGDNVWQGVVSNGSRSAAPASRASGVCLASAAASGRSAARLNPARVIDRSAVMATLDPDDGSVAPHEDVVLTVEALRTGG